MNGLKAFVVQIWRLFVDDGSFALAIAVWLGVVWAAAPRLPVLRAWQGAILFAGLAVILAQSALRSARRSAVARNKRS